MKNEIESLKVIESKPDNPNNSNKPQLPSRPGLGDEISKEEPDEPDNPIEPPREELPDEPSNPIEPPSEESPSEPDNPVEPPDEELPNEPNNPTNPPDQDDIQDKKEVIVNSDSTLREALKDKSVDIIKLGKDIRLQNYELNISRPVIIDGNNYTIDGIFIKSQAILIGGEGVKLNNLNVYGKDKVITAISANAELNNIKVINKSTTESAINIISSIVKVNDLELDSKYSGIELRKNKNINQLKLIIDGEVANISKDDEKNNKVIRIKDIDNIGEEDIIDFGIYEEQYEYEVITNEGNLKDKIYYRKEDLTSN